MMTEKEKNRNNDLNNLEYINSFGAIFSENTIINNNDKKIVINNDDIRKCFIKKSRNLKKNYIFLSFLFISIYSYFIFPSITSKLCFIVISLISFFMFLYIKVYNYTFFMLTKMDYVEVKLNLNSKEDAKKIVSFLRSKRKNGK